MFMSNNKLTDTTALVTAMVANSARLGLTWAIRFGTVESVHGGLTYVLLDGEPDGAVPQPAVPLTVQPATRARITAFVTSPTDIFIIGVDPSPGKPVMKWRNTIATSIPNGGSGTFVPFDTFDLDVYNAAHAVGTTASWLPTVAGYYWLNCRGVFAVNATSRRGAFVSLNGTTSGTGTIGGASLQAPAAGTAQLGGGGLAYMDGVADFAGLRLIQDSGGALNTSNTDGGSLLEAVYLGSPVTT